MLEMLPIENFKNSNPPVFCLSASEPDYLPCAMPRDPVFFSLQRLFCATTDLLLFIHAAN